MFLLTITVSLLTMAVHWQPVVLWSLPFILKFDFTRILCIITANLMQSILKLVRPDKIEQRLKLSRLKTPLLQADHNPLQQGE